MSIPIEDIRARLPELNDDEKRTLVEEILAQLHHGDPHIAALWEAEAERREKAYDAGRLSARPLEDILDQLDLLEDICLYDIAKATPDEAIPLELAIREIDETLSTERG